MRFKSAKQRKAVMAKMQRKNRHKLLKRLPQTQASTPNRWQKDKKLKAQRPGRRQVTHPDGSVTYYTETRINRSDRDRFGL